MQEKFSKLLKNSKGVFIIGFFLTLLTAIPFFRSDGFIHHDDVQYIRLHQVNECIKDFQIPCRWVPDLGGGYGYPLFNYYAPLPYYWGELFYLVSGSLLLSVKIMFLTTIIGSYAFMFILARKYWGDLGALVSSVAYSFVPYHAANLYIRGAMGELWAFMFFPFILFALTKLVDKLNIKNSILFGASYALLIMSHNISAMIFFPITLIFAIVLILIQKKSSVLPYLIFGFTIAFGLSAFYIFPAYFEKGLVHVDTTTMGYFSYTEHFKGLRKLFSWGWELGPSIREVPGGEMDADWYQIGWVHVVLTLISFATVLRSKRIQRKNLNKILFFFLSLSMIVFCIFMIHPRSLFLWNLIPLLRFLQFPWRFLILISFFISLIAGFYVERIKKGKMFVVLLTITLLVSYNFRFFKPEGYVEVNNQNLTTGETWEKQIKRSIFDYLPICAEMPPAELSIENYHVISGDVIVKDFKKGTNWFEFRAEAKEPSTIRISQYYFPNWRVTLGGEPVKIDYNNKLGLITINLPEGEHWVQARLFNSPLRSFSNLLSVVSFFVAVYFLVKLKNK